MGYRDADGEIFRYRQRDPRNPRSEEQRDPRYIYGIESPPGGARDRDGNDWGVIYRKRTEGSVREFLAEDMTTRPSWTVGDPPENDESYGPRIEDIRRSVERAERAEQRELARYQESLRKGNERANRGDGSPSESHGDDGSERSESEESRASSDKAHADTLNVNGYHISRAVFERAYLVFDRDDRGRYEPPITHPGLKNETVAFIPMEHQLPTDGMRGTWGHCVATSPKGVRILMDVDSHPLWEDLVTHQRSSSESDTESERSFHRNEARAEHGVRHRDERRGANLD